MDRYYIIIRSPYNNFYSNKSIFFTIQRALQGIEYYLLLYSFAVGAFLLGSLNEMGFLWFTSYAESKRIVPSGFLWDRLMK